MPKDVAGSPCIMLASNLLDIIDDILYSNCCILINRINSMGCHGSGVERTVQKEYRSVMSRDESLTPGPKVTFPQAGQPSAKGKERAAEEQPASSAERRFDETWLERTME